MQLSPEGLAQLYNMPVEATFQADALRNQLMQSGALSNQAASIKNLYDTQNNPGLVEQTKLENQSKMARLPGELASSQSMQLKTQREAAGQQDAISQARMKFIKEASDHDISMLENKAQQMAYSSDPKIRAQGEQLLTMHRDIVKEKSKEAYKADRMIGQIKESGNQARLTQGQAIEAGKYKQNAARSADDALEKALTSGAWDKVSSAYDYKAQEAATAGDREAAQYFAQKSKEYADKYMQSRSLAKTGGLDVGGVADLPTFPAPSTRLPSMRGAQSQEALQADDLANGVQYSSPEVQRRVEASRGLPKPSVPPALPPGTTNNGDGTFTLPDGRKVRPKQ